jgi:2-keto-4-pentenoate hydratase/2-oxohepta-3-ene-1,7-dioic acid hydratase in catechol pathway
MKLVNYRLKGEPHLGAVKGDWVVDIPLALDLLAKGAIRFDLEPGLDKAPEFVLQTRPATLGMIEILARGLDWLAPLDRVLGAAVRNLAASATFRELFTPSSAADLRAPIPRPGKIICVGRNYAEHARERGSEVPTQPIFFLKSNNTICGPGDAIVIPTTSQQVDYEAELALVIGTRTKNIPEEKAYDHVAGYLIMNDVSARDMQSADKQWFRGKSCDTFAPIGPWIVTKDEILDPHSLRISLTLNGRTMQDSNTGHMVFTIPYLISYLSRSMTLEPGDIISTGTPEGVGASRKPPLFLKAGDIVSITIERIGTLTNAVSLSS